MTASELENRLSAIEQDLAALKNRVLVPSAKPNDWVEKIAGMFARPEDQAAFDLAMRYGREWRVAQRPKAHKRRMTKKK